MDYQCELCGERFEKKNSYWSHKNRLKKPCISREQCIELVEEVSNTKNREKFLRVKTEKLDEENKKLKERIQQLETLTSDIEEIKDSVKEHLANQQIYINNNNNNYNDFSDKSMNLNMIFSEARKERMDHIDSNMYLSILDHRDFNDTMKHLVSCVYFHPKAPENWKWCILDKNAKYGAVEYNHETNSLIRKPAESVITENVENIVYRVVDVIDQLQVKHRFNRNQIYSYNKLFGLFGTEMATKTIQSIKDVGYANRNLPKALWGQSNIKLESRHIK